MDPSFCLLFFGSGGGRLCLAGHFLLLPGLNVARRLVRAGPHLERKKSLRTGHLLEGPAIRWTLPMHSASRSARKQKIVHKRRPLQPPTTCAARPRIPPPPRSILNKQPEIAERADRDKYRTSKAAVDRHTLDRLWASSAAPPLRVPDCPFRYELLHFNLAFLTVPINSPPKHHHRAFLAADAQAVASAGYSLLAHMKKLRRAPSR